MSLTVGSLFAGIGGLELGLERAGMKVRWQVEKDEYCRKVLARHWPDVERYEDVKDVGAHNLEDVDLICGGFPCQDISRAGKKAGIEGERSGLWSEMRRCVRELRPQWVLVENVPDIRFQRGLGVVLGELAEIGYDAEWDCIPAAAVGAHHLRDRFFLVAYPQGARLEGAGVAERPAVDTPTVPDPDGERGGTGARIPEERRPHLPDADGDAANVGDADCGVEATEPRVFGGPQTAPSRAEWTWVPEPDVARVVDGFRPGVDRRRALGNAVVPQVAEWIGRRIVEAHEKSGRAA